SFTGSVPNNHWGYGKVNAFQAMSRLVTSVSEEKSAPVAESFRLFESYPNPLNLMSGVSRQARIRYRLPSAEEVHFKIVNLLGQVVKEVSIRQTAGTHQFYWNGRNREGSLLPSGIYFYEIKAGRFHRAKKMVLVR
ncbi:MAG TPA: T9SS type A sorting domain-containing protein, partial [Bacteroidetes bacterium]|nr:T9SS type A sorting domain-containing protein [Bacteroidota bacterium]